MKSAALISHMFMCVLAIATNAAPSNDFPMWGVDLHFGAVSKQSDLRSPATNLVPSVNATQNQSQVGAAPSKGAMCPTRKNVNAAKARASMRTDLNLKKDLPATTKSAFEETEQEIKNQEESRQFYEQQPDHDTGFEETSEQGKKYKELASQCSSPDHNKKVHCMVDLLFKTESAAMHIEESNGKIEVIRSESGETVFEETMTDPGQLLEEISSKHNNLETWDNFDPDSEF